MPNSGKTPGADGPLQNLGPPPIRRGSWKFVLGETQPLSHVQPSAWMAGWSSLMVNNNTKIGWDATITSVNFRVKGET
jgi:hypothetical protein